MNSVATTKYMMELRELRQTIDDMFNAYHRTEGIVYGNHVEDPKERQQQFDQSVDSHRIQLVKNLSASVARLEKIKF